MIVIDSNWIRRFLLAGLLFSLIGVTHGQVKKKVNYLPLHNKIIKSDSVVILSHINYYMLLQDTIYNNSNYPRVIYEDSINSSLVKEKIQLSKSQILKLSDILGSYHQTDNQLGIVDLGCYKPHHTILFYKNSKFSSIELCFSCSGFRYASDIKKSSLNFDYSKWRILKAYFESLGIKYGFNNNDR